MMFQELKLLCGVSEADGIRAMTKSLCALYCVWDMLLCIHYSGSAERCNCVCACVCVGVICGEQPNWAVADGAAILPDSHLSSGTQKQQDQNSPWRDHFTEYANAPWPHQQWHYQVSFQYDDTLLSKPFIPASSQDATEFSWKEI